MCYLAAVNGGQLHVSRVRHVEVAVEVHRADTGGRSHPHDGVKADRLADGPAQVTQEAVSVQVRLWGEGGQVRSGYDGQWTGQSVEGGGRSGHDGEWTSQSAEGEGQVRSGHDGQWTGQSGGGGAGQIRS